ncbi:hypothetical protein A0J61_11015 [Choanephora cucurbitarum]|uniref:Uncharacterized protein n=1 Tax=Choanephora cucurbitarum TaxID=101091 RepID=A0A1C7MWW1_9FUNG|nr:hypothetical protein A0J61_11015 [Choanephora cucurbitarum]
MSDNSNQNDSSASNEGFTLPPIIPDRVIPVEVPDSAKNFDPEAEAREKNLKWFKEHGGDTDALNGNGKTIGGLTLEPPANVPPM